MRRALLALVAATTLLVAVGCKPFLRPPGDAPLRYRDAVFADVTKTADVPFATAVMRSTSATVTLKLDRYEPTGDSATARPVIVWVHGGSFKYGDKTSPELVDQANEFAKKGYVNVSIDYRLSPQGCAAAAPNYECVNAIIDAKHDAQAAVRYLKANAAALKIDPNRIAINGTSAGAITSLNVGFDSTEVGSGGSNPGYSSAVRSAVSLSGARLMGAPDAGDAPALLFHGTADIVVPYAWATKTVDDARAAGIETYLTSWEGDGHVPYVAHRAEILEQTTNFLYWTLDLEHAPV